MYEVTSVSPSVTKINFKADSQRQANRQYFVDSRYDNVVPKKTKKKYSAGQILGYASSAIVVAFFGLMLGRELKSSYLERKVTKALKKTNEKAKNSLTDIMNNCNNDQIKRSLAEEYSKGPMMMSNKKIEALKQLAQIPETEVKPIDIERAKKILDDRVIGMDGIKKEVIEFLEYRNKCIEQGIKPDKPLIISFDGPAGTAKTTLAQAIAEASSLPHREINMAGATGKAKIIGNESVYTGATWGEFADAQLEHNTRNIVYTLDELEKTGTSDFNGKVEDTLLPLLDGRHKVKDDFLGVDIDISDSIVVITTNEFNKLSEPLRTRISYQYKIAPYTLAEKAKIAKFKFDKSMTYHKINDKVEIEDKVYDLIARSANDQGGRQVSETVQNLAHKIFILQKNSNGKIKVTEKMVEDWLKQTKNA